jgi:hypothetical protein
MTLTCKWAKDRTGALVMKWTEDEGPMPKPQGPYQIQVGNPTPPAALPFLFAGSQVPVDIGTILNAVVIDWDAAASEYQS